MTSELVLSTNKNRNERRRISFTIHNMFLNIRRLPDEFPFFTAKRRTETIVDFHLNIDKFKLILYMFSIFDISEEYTFVEH